MTKAYKYRIYPTAQQAVLIDRTIGVCRLVYNLALEVKIRAYKHYGVSLSAYTIGNQLPSLKQAYPWMKEVNSQALTASINKIDIAFKGFFSGKGYPKFKRKRSGGSFECHNNARRIDWEKSLLTVPKIPNIPIRLSRRFSGEIRTVTISKTPTGKYFAAIRVAGDECPVVENYKSGTVGIDLGISAFATLSTGEKIDNPKYLRAELKRLKVLQRRASRKKKGSKNQKKGYLRVALLYERIANQRQDFLHKLSTRLIRDNQTDIICIEDLAVSNMVKNRKLAQAISEVSWSEFVRQLEYKGKWYGKNVIKIDRFYASSKMCSSCGHKVEEMDLSVREWVCICGAQHDRDINAAINIKNIGLLSGRGTPVEPAESSAIAGAMNQELIANNKQ
jgi:putative transposase